MLISAATSDGIDIQPIYSRRTSARDRWKSRRAGGAWRVIARVDHPEAAVANGQALDDLVNGADGLQVVFAGAAGAYGYGLASHDADAATLDA